MPRNDNIDSYEASLRKSAKWNRVLSAAGALVVIAMLVGLRVFRSYAKTSRSQRPDSVLVVVRSDGLAHYQGRGYGTDEIRPLLAKIRADHPGSEITLCTGGVRGWAGALSYEGLQAGVTVGVIDDPNNALCAP